MIHFAKIQLMDVNIDTGMVINKDTMKINELLNTNVEKQHRIIVDADIPNSTGNPTQEDYVILEHNAGYNLVYMDQYNVVTHNINVQIGAVEIKDHTSNDRVHITTDNEMLVRVSAIDITSDINLVEINGDAITLGQKLMVTSLPVVIAENQSEIAFNLTQVNGDPVNVGFGEVDSGTLRIANARDARGIFNLANYFTPLDGTAAFTSTVTITCAGFPFVVDDANCKVVFVQVKPVGGTWQAPYINGQDGVSLIAAADIITIAGAGTPFVADDTYIVGIRYQDKAYTVVSNSNRSEEINPLSLQVLSESIVDVTDLAVSTYHYPAATGMSMDGYRDMSLTGRIACDGAMSMRVEVTNDEDAASADWIQIFGYRTNTNNTVDEIAVNNTTALFSWDFDDLNYRLIRVVLVVAHATNTAIVKMRRKAL